MSSYSEILISNLPNQDSTHYQTNDYQTIEISIGYIDTFSLSQQYRNNKPLLYLSQAGIHKKPHCNNVNTQYIDT